MEVFLTELLPLSIGMVAYRTPCRRAHVQGQIPTLPSLCILCSFVRRCGVVTSGFICGNGFFALGSLGFICLCCGEFISTYTSHIVFHLHVQFLAAFICFFNMPHCYLFYLL
jgi:hypothetical protein